ncbi:MAG: hypothetical protein E7015_03470 [Alphaproteobacteria bacterium]|nr:hypothetical protein [Alphaproteobacteria bacterium]
MFKTKIIILGSIITFLLIIGIYHQNNLSLVKTNYKIEKENHLKKLQIESLLNCDIFLKPHNILFAKSCNPEKKIKQIVNQRSLRLTKLKRNEFNLLFSVTDEDIIHEIIHRLQSELNGISNVTNLKISINKNLTFDVDLRLKIYDVPSKLQNDIKIWEYHQLADLQYFSNSTRNKLHKLNGVNHYGTAYINGSPYKQGQMIGRYKISKIYDDFIILQSRNKTLKISVDNCW